MASMYNGGTALLVTFALLALALLLALQPVAAQTTVDYDDDDDGFIDIRTPAQLDAIRHDADGNGDATVTAYVTAFPDRDASSGGRMGCPGGACTGYELRADLDLSGYSNWTGITDFNSTLNGNGHTISGLTVNTSTTRGGLFNDLEANSVIRQVGIIAPNIRVTGLGAPGGGLAGRTQRHSVIEASYVLGGTITLGNGLTDIGGLVGHHQGTIRASYATASLHITSPCNNCNSTDSGGLVGHNNGGDIIASYATGRNYITTGSGQNIGGLVGQSETPGSNTPVITDSYCDTQATGLSNCVGATSGVSVSAAGYRTAQLKRPVAYAGPYANWNLDLDSDPMTDDDPWDFGSPRTYPLLKADRNGDGTATCEEFGSQPCYAPPGPPAYNWRTDHPESYQSARTGITAACAVRTTGAGDDAVTTSTLTFDLAEYTRPVTLALSLWDKTHFRSLPSLGIAMPALQREGQTATVEVVTDPARTRFRLDGPYGLNLVLGYADCHTDDS